eukprot:1951188-Rhodomonas_salina.3
MEEMKWAMSHCLCSDCNGTHPGTCEVCVPRTEGCNYPPPEYECFVDVSHRHSLHDFNLCAKPVTGVGKVARRPQAAYEGAAKRCVCWRVWLSGRGHGAGTKSRIAMAGVHVGRRRSAHEETHGALAAVQCGV